ncbi:unnamed protein product [Cercospora beticola]|nr:unnamed protein product [Cercospora beticola]
MRLQHKRCRRTSRRSAETSTSIGPSQGLRLLTARPHSTSIRRSLVISMAKQPEASHSAALSSDKIKPPPATFRPQPHPRTSSLQPTANLTAKEDVTSAAQLAITNLEKPARPQRRPSFDRSNLNAFLLSQIAHDTGWISTKREPRAMRNTTVNNKPTALFVDDSTLGASTSAANCDDGELKYPRLVREARGTSLFQEYIRRLGGVAGASHRIHLRRRSVGGSEHAYCRWRTIFLREAGQSHCHIPRGLVVVRPTRRTGYTFADGRIATDILHRRLSAVPRVQGNVTVNWQQRNFIEPCLLESYWRPLPSEVDISLRTHYIPDIECSAVSSRELSASAAFRVRHLHANTLQTDRHRSPSQTMRAGVPTRTPHDGNLGLATSWSDELLSHLTRHPDVHLA